MSSEIQPGAAEGMTPEQPTSNRSIWAVIGGVFISPGSAFTDFKMDRRIWIPIILTIVLAGIGTVMVAEQEGMLAYNLMKNSPLVPPQALEQMRTDAQNPDMLMNSLTGGIPVIVIGVLVALIAWFMGSVIFGKQAKFMAVWGVQLIAGLIPLVGGLIRGPMVIAKDSMLVSFGLAALFPEKDFTSFVYTILFYFDAFAIWGIVAAGFGYAAIFGLSNGKGMAVSVVASGILIMLIASLGIVGMSMAGIETSFF